MNSADDIKLGSALKTLARAALKSGRRIHVVRAGIRCACGEMTVDLSRGNLCLNENCDQTWVGV